MGCLHGNEVRQVRCAGQTRTYRTRVSGPATLGCLIQCLVGSDVGVLSRCAAPTLMQGFGRTALQCRRRFSTAWVPMTSIYPLILLGNDRLLDDVVIAASALLQEKSNAVQGLLRDMWYIESAVTQCRCSLRKHKRGRTTQEPISNTRASVYWLQERVPLDTNVPESTCARGSVGYTCRVTVLGARVLSLGSQRLGVVTSTQCAWKSHIALRSLHICERSKPDSRRRGYFQVDPALTKTQALHSRTPLPSYHVPFDATIKLCGERGRHVAMIGNASCRLHAQGTRDEEKSCQS